MPLVASLGHHGISVLYSLACNTKAYKLNAGWKISPQLSHLLFWGWIWDFWLLLRFFPSSYGRFLLHTAFLSLPATLTIFLPGRLLVRNLSSFKCLSGIGIALLLNVQILLALLDTALFKVRCQVIITHVVNVNALSLSEPPARAYHRPPMVDGLPARVL